MHSLQVKIMHIVMVQIGYDPQVQAREIVHENEVKLNITSNNNNLQH
jgi:hypothetical protein